MRQLVLDWRETARKQVQKHMERALRRLQFDQHIAFLEKRVIKTKEEFDEDLPSLQNEVRKVRKFEKTFDEEEWK